MTTLSASPERSRNPVPVSARGPLAGAALLVAATAVLLPPAACAEEGRVLCPALFAGGQPPALLNPRLALRTHGLCFDAFAVLDSGVTRGPRGRPSPPPRRAWMPRAAGCGSTCSMCDTISPSNLE